MTVMERKFTTVRQAWEQEQLKIKSWFTSNFFCNQSPELLLKQWWKTLSQFSIYKRILTDLMLTGSCTDSHSNKITWHIKFQGSLPLGCSLVVFLLALLQSSYKSADGGRCVKIFDIDISLSVKHSVVFYFLISEQL